MPIQIANTTTLIAENQSAKQIVDLLCIAIKDSERDFPALRRMFKGKTNEQTLKNIYQYTQEYFRYSKESPANQKVRTASRVMHDKKVDCKGYSTFILASCLACGIPAKFRLASYNYFDKTPTHVYVTSIDEEGNEIILDGTMRNYNAEHPYKHIKDVKPKIKNKMALNYLQGIDDLQVINGRAERKSRRSERKEKRKDKRADRKEARKERREERGTLIARVGAAPARGAFLIVLKLNALKLADKLAMAYKKDVNAVQKFWAKVGGKLPDLKKAIEQGSKASLNGTNADMGAIAVGTALATATPIMIAVSTLIKQLGLFQGNEESEFDETIEDGLDMLDEDDSFTKEYATVPTDDEVFQFQSKSRSLAPRSASDLENGDSGEVMSTTTMLMIGGAVILGGYLLLSKK